VLSYLLRGKFAPKTSGSTQRCQLFLDSINLTV